jgi:hypothetical protein
VSHFKSWQFLLGAAIVITRPLHKNVATPLTADNMANYRFFYEGNLISKLEIQVATYVGRNFDL